MPKPKPTGPATKVDRRRRRPEADVDTRERILNSAIALFAERGFDGTATKAIAERAGVPSGLLFYYFSSKEQLLEEILRGESWHDAFRLLLESLPDAPVLERFSALAAGMLQWMERNRERAMVFFQEMTSHRKCAADLRQVRQQLVRHFASLIEAEIERGTLREANASTIAHVLTSDLLVAGIVDKPAHPKRFAAEMIECVLGPLRLR
jgi:AcrR family transcriptional regulator